jgi:hypothetical protein
LRVKFLDFEERVRIIEFTRSKQKQFGYFLLDELGGVVNEVEQHLEMMLAEYSWVQFNHSLNDEKSLLDGH